MSSSCDDLSDFFAGRLDPVRASAFREHLADCGACRVDLHTDMQVVIAAGAEGRLGSAMPPEAPPASAVRPPRGRDASRTALGWILDHPELGRRHAGQYVAFRAEAPFDVVRADADLDALLDALGDDLSGIYVHHFC